MPVPFFLRGKSFKQGMHLCFLILSGSFYFKSSDDLKRPIWAWKTGNHLIYVLLTFYLRILFILLIGTILKDPRSFENYIKYYLLLCISSWSNSHLPAKVKNSEKISNRSKVPQVVGDHRGDSNPVGPILKPICYLPSCDTAFSTLQTWGMAVDRKLQRGGTRRLVCTIAGSKDISEQQVFLDFGHLLTEKIYVWMIFWQPSSNSGIFIPAQHTCNQTTTKNKMHLKMSKEL